MQIKIGNHVIDKYESVNVSLGYDTIADEFSFIVLFDPNNATDRAIFKPGTYQRCSISHNGELLITGVMLCHSFSSSATKQLASLSGGSVTGILAECSVFTGSVTGNVVMPGDASTGSLQHDGDNLVAITNKVIAKYGLPACVVDNNVADECNKVFTSTAAKVTETAEHYLSTLARQRNLVLTHTTDGRILYTRCRAEKLTISTSTLARVDVLTTPKLDVYDDPGRIIVINHNSSSYSTPIYHFAPGEIVWTRMTLNFNGQNMHSYIQAVGEQGESLNSPDAVITNAYVKNTFRYLRVEQTSGDDNDTENVAQNERSSDLANLTLTIEMVGWELGGKLVRPNQIITVYNPEVYLFKKSRWFIERVTFSGTVDEPTCTLSCVVPETYNDEDVVNVFD